MTYMCIDAKFLGLYGKEKKEKEREKNERKIKRKSATLIPKAWDLVSLHVTSSLRYLRSRASAVRPAMDTAT